MKLLVAEDELTIALQYRIFLQHAGHNVTLTSDGQECLDAYKSAVKELFDKSEQYLTQHPPFDVVIMDVRMPNLDGKEAAILIREINPTQRIIFVTAYSKSPDGSLYETPDNMEVLTKPVDLDTLLEAIQSDKRPFLSSW
jgi:CheY-like chemotaxis protein